MTKGWGGVPGDTTHPPLTLEPGCHMTTYTAGGIFGGRLIL